MSARAEQRIAVGVLLVALAFASLLPPHRAAADSVHGITGGLPAALTDAATVTDGRYVFVFGGVLGGSASDKIFRFDPLSYDVEEMGARLPRKISHISAAWIGDSAYLFGGKVEDGTMFDSYMILKYTPATDTIGVVASILPSGIEDGTAVAAGNFIYVFDRIWIYRYDPASEEITRMGAWGSGFDAASGVYDGKNIYLFGGGEPGRETNQIFRYDPTTDKGVVMPSYLPTERASTSAFFDGRFAFVAGGRQRDGTNSSQILRYDPVSNSVSSAGSLPRKGLAGTSSAWVGSHAYVFGGHGCNWLGKACSTVADIVRYDPRTNKAQVLGGGLPSLRSEASGIWDGQSFYLFGGSSADTYSDGRQIVRFDPGTGTVAVVHQFPYARWGTAAAWDGSDAYIFGGRSVFANDAWDEIYRYNPSTNQLTLMSAVLPTRRSEMSSIYDGRYIYLFGHADARYGDEILRYDPATDSIVTLSAVLPTPRSKTAAAFDGRYAYIFGGWSCSATCGFLDEILRFDPVSHEVVTLPTRLPLRQQDVAATWNGEGIYIAGGYGCRTADCRIHGASSDILRYDPVTDSVETLAAKLPSGRGSPAVFWASDRLYVVGNGESSNDIVSVTFEPGAPLSLTAEDRGSSVELRWQPPAANSHRSPLTSYRLYASADRSTDSLIAELDPSQLSFVETGVTGRRFYRISAVNAFAEGAKSEAAFVRVSPPGSPRVLRLAGVTAAGIDLPPSPIVVTVPPSVYPINWRHPQLRWDSPLDQGGDPITSYRIYAGRSPGVGAEFVGEVPAWYRFWGQARCDTGDVCTWTVRAVNAGGEGPPSNEVRWMGYP